MEDMGEDRAKGCFYGCAVGDALGAPLEFKPRDAVPLVTDMLPSKQFGLSAGSWTDDTSMMLCLAEALASQGGVVDGHAALSRYVAWSRHGYLSVNGVCFDIGRTVRYALYRYEEGRDPVCDNRTQERSCGNGSLMRLAAVPIVFAAAGEAVAYEAGVASSLTTHAHPLCTHACGILASLCAKALNGASKAALLFHLEDLAARLPGPCTPLRSRICSGAFMALSRDEVSSSGYVVDTLEAALWAFYTTDTFEAGAVRVVNLADDADTVGAVYGTLAGAHYGYHAIPQRWLDGLQGRHTLYTVFAGLDECRGLGVACSTPLDDLA